MTSQYRAAAGRSRNAAERTARFWTRGARTVTDLVPGLPRVDLVPAVAAVEQAEKAEQAPRARGL